MNFKTYIRVFSISTIVLASAVLTTAQVLPPRIFYSDLDSGPNSGGENGQGSYVTIYGKNFGTTQASSVVKVGTGSAAVYKSWSDTKVVFQLGASATSGNIVVTTAVGSSNGVPFTVRSGNIHFVATTGNDANAGTFASPFRTMPYAVQTSAPGDVIYAMNGVSQTAEDGQGWSSQLTMRAEWCGGTQRALVAYPGAKVTLGSPTDNLAAIRSTDSSAGGGACTGAWTFAGLYIPSGNGVGLGGGSNWRIVGNEITCPNGNGAGSCFEASQTSNVKFYGNYVHHTGAANASALYQSVYFTTDSNHFEIGWNTIAYVRGCRGLQVHSSPLGSGGSNDPTGHNQYDFSIHDNIIHDTQCDGMILATVDPSKGPVSVYNNLIYNAGQGPNNPEGSGGWTCISFPGTTNNGAAGGGSVEVYGNTLYNCGSFANPPYSGVNGGILNGGGNANLKLHIRNNIIDNPSGAPYLLIYQPNGGSLCADSQNCSGIYGSNNLFRNAGAVPINTNITASVGADPSFLSLTTPDFHLSPASPAAQAGTPTPQTTDFDGLSLPQGNAYPIGAYALHSQQSSGVSISMNPTTVSLTGNQTQLFSATVTGSANTAATWSTSPSMGTLSSSGMYTAPSVVGSAQTVLVTATSAADTSKSATASISLIPISITISPSVSLSAGQTNQFTATVTGSSQTGVNWTISPSVGTLTTSGFYTAPLSIGTGQTITITASSVVDPSKTASATITLLATTPTVGISVSPTTATIQAGGSVPLTATVTGTTNHAVTWSVTPAVGSVSTGGVYSAPSSVSSTQTVTVKATSSADSTKSAIATITINPVVSVGISVSPSSATLAANGATSFSATVTGTTNTAVTWSISPVVGSINSSGFYTAPPSITVSQTVTVKAISSADSTKSATATVTLVPPAAITVAVSPLATTLVPGGKMQFAATVANTSNTAVTWSMSPAVGRLSGTGLYTAPATITSPQIVVVKAVSGADSTKSGTATITLQPSVVTGGIASYQAHLSLSGNSLSVSWASPASSNRQNYLDLTGVDAPGWWMVWSQPTKTPNGSMTVPTPTIPGIYELRLLQAGGYNVLARSAALSLGTTGFAIASAVSAAAGSALQVAWAVGSGSLPGDYVGLYPAGATSDQSVTAIQTNGITGSGQMTMPSTPGAYELRYILGTETSYTYVPTVITSPITVN